MGQYGRIGLTVTGMVVGSYLGGPLAVGFGGILGTLAGSMLFPSNQGGVGLPTNARASRSIVDGFSQTTLSTQIPVPLVFGKSLLHGNILSAILLGEGNKRLVSSVGIGEGTLTLQQLYLDGKEFNKLTNYAAARGDDNNKSWFEFYGDGQLSTINIANSGKKRIGGSGYQGDTVESYPIQILGVGAGDEVKFYIQHSFPAGGSSQSWTIKAKEQDHTEEYQLVSSSRFFEKFVVYEVPSGGCGGGTEQRKKSVEGCEETLHTASLPYEGKWIFILQVNSAGNNGYITFDAVEVLNDSGQDLAFNYHNTAYCLINLVKTASISSNLRFNFLVTGMSDNPATALRTILENGYFGLNIANEIDQDSFDSAASWCTTHGYKVNVALLDVSYANAIELIKNAGRLLLIRNAGVYKCIPEEDNTVAASFDEASDILPGSLEWGFIGKENKFNRLRVKYMDEAENYTLQDVILEDNIQIDADGYVREQTFDLSAVTSMSVAAELGNIYFKKSKFIDIYINFVIGFKDALVEVGDIVEITSGNLQFSAKEFRVLGIDEVENFGYQIYAVEHFAQIYDPLVNFNNWHPLPKKPVEPGVSAPPLVYIDSVSQEIIPLSGGGYQARMSVNYTVPGNDPAFKHVELWIRPGYSSVWEYVGINDSGNIKYSVSEAYLDYEVKLVSVSPSGEKSVFAESPNEYFYPTLAPFSTPAYGGGRWGVQPWGR